MLVVCRRRPAGRGGVRVRGELREMGGELQAARKRRQAWQRVVARGGGRRRFRPHRLRRGSRRRPRCVRNAELGRCCAFGGALPPPRAQAEAGGRHRIPRACGGRGGRRRGCGCGGCCATGGRCPVAAERTAARASAMASAREVPPTVAGRGTFAPDVGGRSAAGITPSCC